MDIYSALTEINTIQAGLSISAPVAASIAKVWFAIPPQSAALSDFPCFMNTWGVVESKPVASNTILYQDYWVRMQLLVKDADADRAAAIATAFMPQIVSGFAAHWQLAGAVRNISWRGSTGTATLLPLDFAGFHYIGLDLTLDLHMEEGHSFGY